MFYTHLYCFCSNISISISSVSVTTPVLPSLLIGFAPTPTLPFLVILFQHLHFHFYCFGSHTCSSIFTVSAPSLALSSLLCQLPHLHSVIPAVSAPRPALFLLHYFCSYPCTSIFLFLYPHLCAFPYCFCFQTCTYVCTTSASKTDFSLCCSASHLYFHITSSASITELLSLVILLLSQHLYVFSSAFASTLALYLCCLSALCPQLHRACTFIFTTLL